MAGAEQPVVPSTATSQCPAAGTTHPHGVRQDAHPAQTSAGMGLGYWQARWPSPARLGCSGSVRVSGRRGLCGDVERGVCVCVGFLLPEQTRSDGASSLSAFACLSRLPAFPSHLARRAATLAGAVSEF